MFVKSFWTMCLPLFVLHNTFGPIPYSYIVPNKDLTLAVRAMSAHTQDTFQFQ